MWGLIVIIAIALIAAGIIAYRRIYGCSTASLDERKASGLAIRTHTGRRGGVQHPRMAFLNTFSNIIFSDAALTVDYFRALLESNPQTRMITGEPMPVDSIVDRTIPGPGGDIPIRIYTPAGPGPFPGIVYFHGGGWIAGSIASHENITTRLANHIPAVVVSVDYRLAPEHRFPAAFEDAYAATTWVAEHAADLKIDPHWIATAGDSAGGTLSTLVALQARDHNGPHLAYQIMLYPVTNCPLDTTSITEHADQAALTADTMRFYRDQYLPDPDTWRDPHASPLLVADLSNLPPALIITAEFDILRDEGELYGQRLHEAGVPVTVTRYLGVSHAFSSMLRYLPRHSRQSLEEVCAAVQSSYYDL